MVIITSDGNKAVNVGTVDIWICLVSTITGRLNKKKDLPLAIQFLETGHCAAKDGYETARQINLIRDRLAMISPDKVIYDPERPEIKAPWANNISPVITSCANYFTTADGKDLLFELVSIFTYAQLKNVSVDTAE